MFRKAQKGHMSYEVYHAFENEETYLLHIKAAQQLQSEINVNLTHCVWHDEDRDYDYPKRAYGSFRAQFSWEAK